MATIEQCVIKPQGILLQASKGGVEYDIQLDKKVSIGMLLKLGYIDDDVEVAADTFGVHVQGSGWIDFEGIVGRIIPTDEDGLFILNQLVK